MWLEQCLQLPYRKSFRAAGIDGQKLIELTEEQLSDLGVTESSHLLRLLSHIAVFRSQLGRTLLVSEDATGQGDEPLPRSAIANGSWQRQPVQEEAERNDKRRPKQTLRDEARSLERRRVAAAKSAGSAEATTPRGKSMPGLCPVLKSSASSPASGSWRGDRTSRSDRTNRTPQGQQTPRTARGSGRPVPQAQQTTRSAERTPMRPQSSPASSSTWSPTFGQSGQGDAQNGMQEQSSLLQHPPWSPDEAGSSIPDTTRLDGSGNVVATAPMYFESDRGGTNELMRSDAFVDQETSATRARSAPRLSASTGTSTPRLATTPRSAGQSWIQKQELSTLSKAGMVNSEFGRDYNRGAHFFSTSRRLLDPSMKSPEGPEYYEKPDRFYNGAMTKKGVSQFGRTSRSTLECMFTRGQDGPGVGRYEPPASRPIRGGSIGTSSRWRNTAANRKSEKTPGPQAYSPSHHFKSGFK